MAVLPGARSGRPTILSSTEEKEEQDLVQFLLSSAEIGYARTRSEVISIVERMLSARDDHAKQTVMIGWWNKFCKRHPELVLRTPATLLLSRASASIKECIDNYFDVLEKVLDDYDLRDQPSLIFNMDESGFPLDPQPLKTSSVRGKKSSVNHQWLKISGHCISMSQRIRTNYSTFNYLESQDHVPRDGSWRNSRYPIRFI